MIDDKVIRRLILNLKRMFDRFNAGENHGRFRIVGQGNGVQLADAFGDARYLAHSVNARSGVGEVFVETTLNDYHRRGIVMMDHSPRNNWGGNEARRTRLDLMRATAEGMVLLSAAMGNEVGAILPSEQSLRLVRANFGSKQIVAEFKKAQGNACLLEDQLRLLLQQARHHEFAILVLDVYALKVPVVCELITKISKQCELVIVEISDKWDWELPNVGKVTMIQNGVAKKVDTSNGDNRLNYANAAKQRESSSKDFLATLKHGQHHQLRTNEPFGAQFTSTFAPPRKRRAS